MPVCLCVRNFRSRRWCGDRFDDWLVGHQFEPNYLHHPVFRNHRSRLGVKIARFYGLFLSFHSGFFWSPWVITVSSVDFGLLSPREETPFPAGQFEASTDVWKAGIWQVEWLF